MKNKLLILVLGASLFPGHSGSLIAGDYIPETIYDGPYIFIEGNTLRARWIKNSMLFEEFITAENYPEISKKVNLRCRFEDLKRDYSEDTNHSRDYSSNGKIAVITDLHGEFGTYKKLLKANGIIDKDLNWIFGKGHLVILGDIFDRGEKVTEILWHLFFLEKQAAEAGGDVHVLIGNHEFMVMNNDLTFTNRKYREVERFLGTGYSDLYSQNTVLGRWLRSKPVVITIDSILFIHGGISAELARREITVSKINSVYSELLSGNQVSESDLNDAAILTDPENDPLWYRGYFTDTSFCISRLDSILDFYGMRQIVVGHTAFRELTSLYDKRIIGVDAGITNDRSGEMLICEYGVFYRGLHNGRRIKIQ